MMFLAISHNTGDPSPFLQAEAARTEQLQRSGVFQSVFLKADWSGAVILLDAPGPDAAQHALDSLPLVTNRVTRFELTALVAPPPLASGEQSLRG